MSAQVTPLVVSVCLNLVMRFPPVQRATAGGAHPALYTVQHCCWTRFPPSLPYPLPYPDLLAPRARAHILTGWRMDVRKTEHVPLSTAM